MTLNMSQNKTQNKSQMKMIQSTPAQAVLIALTASSMMLSGCSKSDNAKSASAQAGTEFRNVSVGDPTFADEFSKKAYTNAASLTADHAGSDAPYGESAAVAQSLAKLGLATLSANEASAAETHAMHKSRIIRGHLSEWISMNAVAKASTNFDISADKASLQELIELRNNDVVQYTKRMESLQEEINAYNAQIADLDSKSKSERNEGARYELQMTSVTATQAAQLAERVREHSLRADGYELESTRIQGLVGQLLPGAHEVELQVKKAKDQIDLLQLSIDELEQRVRDSKTDSAKARANAEQARSAITTLVQELEDYRESTVIPANEQVISIIRQSIRAAGDANDTAKTSGSIAKASGQEQLARSLSRQARGEAEMAMLYQSIMESGLSGSWSSSADSHAARRDELYSESQQSFQDAASSLRRVRVRGESGEALEAAAVRLDLLGGVEPEPEYTEEYDSETGESEFNEDFETDPETDLDAEDFDEEG
jgi:cell division protein FtsB